MVIIGLLTPKMRQIKYELTGPEEENLLKSIHGLFINSNQNSS